MKLEDIRLYKKGILIEDTESEETTSSGFVLSSANDASNVRRAYIRVVNDCSFKEDLDLIDHILYSKYAGFTISLEGKDYRLIDVSDIMFIKDKF